MNEKVCLRCKGKTLLGVVNKLLKTKCSLTSPSNVLLVASSKLSRQWFEFSLKLEVMGSNPGYLLKSFLLYFQEKEMCKIRFQTPRTIFQILDLEVLFWTSLSHIWVNYFSSNLLIFIHTHLHEIFLKIFHTNLM